MMTGVFESGSTCTRRPIAMVFDVDNLILRNGGSRLGINDSTIGECVSEIGATNAIAYAGFFYPKEKTRLRKVGVRAISTAGNADDFIIAKAKKLIRANFDLVIVSGDGDLGLEILNAADEQQTKVWFWSVRAKASWRLPVSRFADHFVRGRRRRNDYQWLERALSSAESPAFGEAA